MFFEILEKTKKNCRLKRMDGSRSSNPLMATPVALKRHEIISKARTVCMVYIAYVLYLVDMVYMHIPILRAIYLLYESYTSLINIWYVYYI